MQHPLDATMPGMGYPAPEQDDLIVTTILPRLNDVERNVNILNGPTDVPSWRLKSAAYDILAILKEGAELGSTFVPRLLAYSAERPRDLTGDPAEDMWFIM